MNKELDANTREQGMEVVSQLGRAKPKQLAKAKLNGQPLVRRHSTKPTIHSMRGPDTEVEHGG